MANPLIKNWQITLLGIVLLISVLLILFSGVKLGMDFKGGTLYQVELQKEVTADEIARISNIIAQRVDPSGLKDATVYPVGKQFIVVQLTETNPVELEKVESRIRQQGKFEATLDGNIVFTGDEIKKVMRGDASYGVGRLGANAYEWSLPFILNEAAAKRFKEMTFHKCDATGIGANGQPTYECERTIFFLDKPSAIVVTTEEQYDLDSDALNTGDRFQNIPEGTDIAEVVMDSQVKVIILDANKKLNTTEARAAFAKIKDAVVSPDVPESVKNDLNAIGYTVTTTPVIEGKPWLWTTLGARQVINLTEGITNEDIADVADAKEFSSLRISGQRADFTEAKTDLEELAILLESGSLPTPVKSISKETVSPSLGESFLDNIIIMGILAAITVAVVIVIRYRLPKLIIPIFLTGLSEIVILLGFLAITQRPLDLAAFAGLIAAIGTGVDSEIVITDEILGKAREHHESLIQRAKTALFIIATSAFTMIAVMGPIVLFSRNLPGLDKLYGFAVVAIVGALIGILITRPAFTKIVQMIVAGKEAHEHD